MKNITVSLDDDSYRRARIKAATADTSVSGDLCLSVQVLQEFYVQATRSSRKDALSHVQAADFIRVWCRFPVQENTLALLQCSLDTRERFRLSSWDAAVVEAARAGGCRELYSEDMQHGQDFSGVRVINPFL